MYTKGRREREDQKFTSINTISRIRLGYYTACSIGIVFLIAHARSLFVPLPRPDFKNVLDLMLSRDFLSSFHSVR